MAGDLCPMEKGFLVPQPKLGVAMHAPRIVIHGGVAGGASAAAKARRTNEAAPITMFEKGLYVSFANCGLP